MSIISETDLFIEEFNQTNRTQTLPQWMHRNSSELKAIQIAAAFFGAFSLSSIPCCFSLSGLFLSGVAALTGAAVLITTLASWMFVKYITCDSHSIERHVFKEAECKGGRLYYRGHIPILEMDGDNPFEAGEAHGYLLGKEINELRGNFELAVHAILRHPRAKELVRILELLREKIPPEYLAEMAGVSSGYNRWAKEAGISVLMTEDDVLLMHLMPDAKHFHPKELEKLIEATQEDTDLESVACTTLLYKDSKEGVLLCRNMDWCPFGTGGAKSLVMVWKSRNIAAFSIPSMIGVISGWNPKLMLAMNVCPGETSECRGVPSCLFNRQILEKAECVEDIKNLIEKIRPLGPYHLTAADSKGEGACFSFYQGSDEIDHIRFLENNQPLIVVNWRYPDCCGGAFSSFARTDLLNRYFDQARSSIAETKIDWKKLMEKALELSPLVNSWITMHSIVAHLLTGDLSIGWDNGFAAWTPRQNFSMNEGLECLQDLEIISE